MQVGGGIEAELCITHTLVGRPKKAPEAFEIAAYQIRGQRDEQQDRFVVHKLNEKILVIAVFDGHGDDGGRIAEVAARMLPVILENRIGNIIDPQQIAKKLAESFLYIDETLAEKETTYSTESGTTGVVTIITPTHYVSANVGDSRAVLLRRNPTTQELTEGIMLSVDHDIQNTTEVQRACAAGATLDDEYFTVGDSGLQLSRALGDFGMKKGKPPVLLAEPDIKIVRRSGADDAYIWLFSDGITDAMKNYEHVWYINLMNKMNIAGTRDARLLARAVVKDAFTNKDGSKPISESNIVSSDNITMVLARLPERHGSVITAITRRVKTAVTIQDTQLHDTTIKRKPRQPRVGKGSRGVTMKNLEEVAAPK